jgi:hypothetical protein
MLEDKVYIKKPFTEDSLKECIQNVVVSVSWAELWSAVCLFSYIYLQLKTANASTFFEYGVWNLDINHTQLILKAWADTECKFQQ